MSYYKKMWMNQLAQHRDRDLELTNHILPQLAHQRQFLVCNNHCFQRIVLDNLFGQCWYTVLQRGKEAAYKQLGLAGASVQKVTVLMCQET